MRLFIKFVIAILTLMIAISAYPIFASITKPSSITNIIYNPDKIISSFMKDERIQIVYETKNGEKAFGFIVKNGVVTETKIGKIKNPTIIIHCDSEEAKKIMNSKNQILTLIDEIIDSKIIEVKKSSPMFSIMLKILELMKFARDVLQGSFLSKKALFLVALQGL